MAPARQQPASGQRHLCVRSRPQMRSRLNIIAVAGAACTQPLARSNAAHPAQGTAPPDPAPTSQRPRSLVAPIQDPRRLRYPRRRPAATHRETHGGVGLGALGAAPALPARAKLGASHGSADIEVRSDDDADAVPGASHGGALLGEDEQGQAVLQEAAARRQAVDDLVASGIFGPGAVTAVQLGAGKASAAAVTAAAPAPAVSGSSVGTAGGKGSAIQAETRGTGPASGLVPAESKPAHPAPAPATATATATATASDATGPATASARPTPRSPGQPRGLPTLRKPSPPRRVRAPGNSLGALHAGARGKRGSAGGVSSGSRDAPHGGASGAVEDGQGQAGPSAQGGRANGHSGVTSALHVRRPPLEASTSQEAGGALRSAVYGVTPVGSPDPVPGG